MAECDTCMTVVKALDNKPKKTGSKIDWNLIVTLGVIALIPASMVVLYLASQAKVNK